MTFTSNCRNFFTNIDLFQVDTVFIKRQRRKTKNTLGGVLTILVPILCTAVFLFLYYNNELKQDIINTEIISTTTLNEPLKFRVEWNTDIVNISSVYPIELVTSTGKQTLCYQSKMKQMSSSSKEVNNINNDEINNSEIKLCNYDTDLLGEPNGVGFMFETSILKEKKYTLPLIANDFILYHEKNVVAYVISAEKNNFCIYYISKFQSLCYPFKFVMKNNNIYTNTDSYFDDNGNFYLTIYDNIKTTYLFINHKFVQKQDTTNKNKLRYVNQYINFYFINENLISIQVNNSSFTISYVNHTTSTINNYYMNQNYFLLYEYNLITKSFLMSYYNYNSSLIERSEYLINYNTSFNKSVSISKYNLLNNTFDSTFITECDSEVFLSENTKFYTQRKKNVIFYMFSLRYMLNNTHTISNLCIITYNYNLRLFKTKKLLYTYKLASDESILRYYYFGGISDNTISFFEIFYKDKTPNNFTVINFIIIDNNLNFITLNVNQDLLRWLSSNIYTSSINQDSIIFLTRKSNFPLNNDWNNILNIGNVIECYFHNGSCNPLYVSVLNNQYFNFTNSTQLIARDDTWIAKFYISDSVLTLNYSNIVTSLSNQNEFKIQSYNIIKKNKDYFFGLSNYKRLYSININNDEIISNLYNSFTNYYIYDNTLLGHDKKFSCIPNPITKDIDFNTMSIIKNQVICPIYNYINFPFISDIGYQITDSNLITTRYDTNNQIGMFILNLDPFFFKTTTTSTKASIYTIIGNTLSVYSVLLTLFLFLKNKIYNFENQVELNRRNTVDEDNLDLEHGSIVYTDNQIYSSSKIDDTKVDDIKVDDDINIQLSTMRHSSEYIEKLSTV